MGIFSHQPDDLLLMSETTSQCSLEVQRQRTRAALANLFIGDALSMPVHWYYNPGDILRQFPPLGIQRMEGAPDTHPSSIMALHSTNQGGRGSQPSESEKQIIGDVILKGRRHLWGRRNGHYHHGLRAGQNTLNAWWAHRLLKYMVTTDHYTTRTWVQDYIDFMLADPPAHPDTYAESCHRGFFANLESGKDPLECGAVTHDTPSMGALVTVAPLALALLPSLPLVEVQQQCREHVWLTHPDNALMKVVDHYVQLMWQLLSRPADDESPAAFVDAAAVISGTRLDRLIDQPRGDAYVVGRVYSLACYITDSWPSVCYLAARYGQTPEKAMLINTNLGGENAHRGSVLGTLVGLASGGFPAHLFETLDERTTVAGDIEQWLNRYYAN